MADALYELKDKRVWVAGHKGMVGSALVRRLAAEDCDILTVNRHQVDLTRQNDVDAWMQQSRPTTVFVCAATVGGILANDQRAADFLYENLMIEANIIKASFDVKVEKLLFLGSSCIYPKMAAQPMSESALLSGPLEPTNQWYSIAKIAGLKLCEAYRKQYGCDYISAMPTNLYGPGDNFALQSSHVLPALMRKAHDAKLAGQRNLCVWGTGTPKREFLYVDDLADALVYLMRHYSEPETINAGVGTDLSIRELAEQICAIVGFKGSLAFDPSKPDGTPRKLLDVSRLKRAGWRATTPLSEGLKQTYNWFLKHHEQARL